MSKSEHFPVANGGALVCNAPSCEYTAYIGEAAVARGAASETPLAEYFANLWHGHARQFEPGAAPDITVEWELVASCSVCPEGGDMRQGDDNTVECQVCGTYWDHDGTDGETDEDKLEEIRESAHEEALSHAEWLIAGRDREGGIRMRGGRGSLVGRADDTRANVEAWLEASRPGRYRDMYRAALDLLDREAAAEAPEEGVPSETSAVEDLLGGAPAMRRVMDQAHKAEGGFLSDYIFGGPGRPESLEARAAREARIADGEVDS